MPTKKSEIIIKSSDGGTCTILPSRGGLITSWKIPHDNGSREMLWMPKSFPDTGWPNGGIPLMFPFAGRVWHQGKMGAYEVGDVVASMPLHGFLYLRSMTVAHQSAGSVALQ